MKEKVVVLCIAVVVVLLCVSWKHNYGEGAIVNVENISTTYETSNEYDTAYNEAEYSNTAYNDTGYADTVGSEDVYDFVINNHIPVGRSALREIGDGLWYDITTKIVYWWNGAPWRENYVMAPSAYFAPNGKPYRYNETTNTFEEIKDDKE